MEMKNIKLLGVIGVLLALLTPIPVIGFIAGLAGLVLVFISIYELSKKTNNKKIYDNFLVSFILGIVGSVIGGIGLIGTVVARRFELFGTRYFNQPHYFRNFRRLPSDRFFMGRGFEVFGNGINNLPIGVVIFAVAFVLIVYGIIVARSYYLKKSFEEIAKETSIEHFKTAGNLMFIGSILTIVGIGIIIYFIGYIFEVVSFFSLKTEETNSTPPPLPQS